MAFAALHIIGILLLIAVNAFFVAAEFALVSIRDTRIQQLVQARRIGARTVQKLQQRFDDVLLMVQLGVTLASLALGWLGEPAIAALLQRAIGTIPHSNIYSHIIAVAIALALITYFQVILGEIVPKSLAL